MTSRCLSHHALTRLLVSRGLSPSEASAKAAKELAQPQPVDAPSDHHSLVSYIVRSTGMEYGAASVLAQNHASDWWKFR
jgi:hypothetical protein